LDGVIHDMPALALVPGSVRRRQRLPAHVHPPLKMKPGIHKDNGHTVSLDACKLRMVAQGLANRAKT
jgi:hypothetical protein